MTELRADDIAHYERAEQLAGLVREQDVRLQRVLARVHDVATIAADDTELEHRWLHENLLEEGDRVVVTGIPGSGKMSMLRQIGVQTAAGIHPVTHEASEPRNVLLLDAQESEGRAKRELCWPKDVAGDRLEAGRIRLLLDIDLFDIDVYDRLDYLVDEVIDVLQPRLIAVGPIARIARLFGISGDLTQSATAVEELQAALDRLRGNAERAILIEAHPGHGNRRGVIGPSGWNNWPEFGFQLSPGGLFTPWRLAREQTVPWVWPKRWQRNDERAPGRWLFTAAGTADADDRWALIEEAVRESGATTEREIGDVAGLPKTTVHRLLERHATEWAILQAELGLDPDE